jgi:nucleoside-diphosphate kinase
LSIFTLLFALTIPIFPVFGKSENMERTLVIFKPDAMEARRVGAILGRFEGAGLRIVAMKMLRLDESLLREHYAHLVERPFFKDIVAFMSSIPVVVAVLEGENAVAHVREMAGPTDSTLAPKGTIRGDFGSDKTHNMVHASDAPESAIAEIARFFSLKEVF